MKKHFIGYTKDGDYYMELGEGLALSISIGVVVSIIIAVIIL